MTHEEMIIKAHDELISALPKEMTDREKALIEDAFRLARDAHSTQMRDSGIPYIIHPQEVALITLKEMRQKDAAIVAAALLHDVVEDTPYTIDDICFRFGEDVAFLVDAVTKPNKNPVDNFQHILGSAKGDVRVLVLKLADRLNNLRTLGSLSEKRKYKISSETLYFFAPLAGRLGLYKIKSELENLAFQYLNPQEYARIEGLLDEERIRTDDSVNRFMHECLHTVGAEMGGSIGWSIRYRTPYSVWRDMQEMHCDFYHVPFKHYIRVNFDREEVDGELNYSSSWWLTDEDIAFRIYSILTNKYKEQTGSFVNYMAQPKANGYRSLHFRLLNPYGGIEEFHVASDEMRLQSNYGCIVDNEEQWLKRFTDILNELAEDPESLMPGIHDSFYNEDIVAFTPKGMAITLPKGATALDFAYGVHTKIGDHAKYARINGRIFSIRTELKRGDRVEIGTDENAHPKEEWLEAVTSYKAKKCIKAWLNKQPVPRYTLCPHCHPMPGSEIIGFMDADGKVTIHARHCPDAIRMASEKGNTIVSVDDFVAEEDVLYPVKVEVIGIDRYHLLQDILDCIVGRCHLSMSSLCSKTVDDIVTCDIEFAVHSAVERDETVSAIQYISGIEEVNFIQDPTTPARPSFHAAGRRPEAESYC